LSEGRLKHFIVPIFIPNQGCPHLCAFCEQKTITSQGGELVNGRHVKEVLDKAVESKKFHLQRKSEVAFYGGTFTGLPLDQIRDLLEAVAPYIREGLFRSIRVSTRPDTLDEGRLKLMKCYGVDTVELGVQSMDEQVLSLSKRGHTAEDTERAVKTLRKYGFKVGIQLMPGLPGDSQEKFQSTVTQVINLHPDMVRLYPALVIHGTILSRWYREGRYKPMGLEEAVAICIDSCMRLEDKAIPVIRIGLMSSPSLLKKGQIIAGPWHTAFGFLVRSGIYLRGIEPDLPRPGVVSRLAILVSKGDIHLVRGYRNEGLRWIERKTGAEVTGVRIDGSIRPGRVKIEKIL